MSVHFIFVDFENVQPTSLGVLKAGTCQVYIFLGQHQTKLPLDLTRVLQPLGENVHYIQIAGNGANALDFHIAFYIGRLATNHADAEFTIVSKDTGFDPLIKHLTTLGIACGRVNRLDDANQLTPLARTTTPKNPANKLLISFAPARTARPTKSPDNAQATALPKATAKVDVIQQRANEVLTRLAGLKRARPVRLKTLRSSLASWFTPTLPATTLDAVIRRLTDTGHLKVNGGKVSYVLKVIGKK